MTDAHEPGGVADAAFGPYETEAQIRALPMAREVRALHAAGQVRSGDPDRLVSGTRLRHLTEACGQAGIELGTIDQQVLAWLSGWEDATVQVVIGLIARAHAAGAADESADESADLVDLRRASSGACWPTRLSVVDEKTRGRPSTTGR
jgi:hypothetical protein